MRRPFIEGSTEKKICQSQGVKGYNALGQIVRLHHPDFIHFGEGLVTTRPYQRKGMDLQQYFNEYVDWLEMRAYVENIPYNLNVYTEMTAFIKLAYWGDQLLKETRKDRKDTDPKTRELFTQDNIVSTLRATLPLVDQTKYGYSESITQRKVKAPSPSKAPSPHVKQSRHNVNMKSSQKTSKRVHLVDKLDSLDNDLPSDHEYTYVYRVGISAAKSNGFDVSQNCMVCNTSGHAFEDCPILNNHDLLKQIHIRFCGLCKQVNKKTQEAINPKQVYHLQDAANSPSSSDDECSDDEDYYDVAPFR